MTDDVETRRRNLHPEIVIDQLVVYPVKGCRGISITSARIGSLGLVSENGIVKDRTWMVTKKAGKPFITQRQQPKLALVKTRIEPEEALTTDMDPKKVYLVLSAPNMEDLHLCMAEPPSDLVAQCKIDVNVWGWNGAAYDAGPEAERWMTKYLGIPAKLVRYAGNHSASLRDSTFLRTVDQSYSPDSHQHVAFADAFPYLVTNKASLIDLNDRILESSGGQMMTMGDESLEMNRFRPNIVVASARGSLKAWDEDKWNEIKLSNGVILKNVKPCSRCKVPTINQDTGMDGSEPLKTMMQFRSGKALGWLHPSEFKGSVFFGVNMCVVDGKIDSIVRVGDSVDILSWRRMDAPWMNYSL